MPGDDGYGAADENDDIYAGVGGDGAEDEDMDAGVEGYDAEEVDILYACVQGYNKNNKYNTTINQAGTPSRSCLATTGSIDGYNA